MRLGLGTLGFLACALGSPWACQPDLDTLTAGYPDVGGSGGMGASGGATNGGSGALGGTGGTGAPEGGAAGDLTGGAGDAGSGTVGPSNCDNLDRDPNESDVDCGGTSDCPRCETNLRCGANRDCQSAFCDNGRCAEPTCGDGYKNQDETGTDCGGSCAPAKGCDLSVDCRVDADCTSEFCRDDVCTDHCLSDKREADETDKDCGGNDCSPCEADQNCDRSSDCDSKICVNNTCQAATCNDKVQNQDESDKDCGGVCAPEKACGITARCNIGADCESYVCTDGHCAADIDIDTDDVLDDFEDGDYVVSPVGGRVGNWYAYGDGSSTPIGSVENIPDGRGPDSVRGMHASGEGFTGWGSGVGVDVNNPGGGQADKLPYDASDYSGVTFWARSEANLPVTVVLPNADTDPAGMTCAVCDHHFYKQIEVGTDWERYTVTFDELLLEPGGDPAPSTFDPGGLVSVQFRLFNNTTYDFWIDDVAFVR